MIAARQLARAQVEAPARARVLLVDDEPMVLRSITRCLDRMGYAVTPVASASEALDAVGADTFDIILTDHHMPGMTGRDLIQQILARQPALRDRIVVASGDLSGAVIADLVEQTGCRTLQKPFELSELGATLRAIGQGCKSDR